MCARFLKHDLDAQVCKGLKCPLQTRMRWLLLSVRDQARGSWELCSHVPLRNIYTTTLNAHAA